MVERGMGVRDRRAIRTSALGCALGMAEPLHANVSRETFAIELRMPLLDAGEVVRTECDGAKRDEGAMMNERSELTHAARVCACGEKEFGQGVGRRGVWRQGVPDRCPCCLAISGIARAKGCFS